MRTFDELILRRRSIRQFDPNKSIEKEQIDAMVKAAQEAPSWGNFQASRYHVVMTKDMKSKLCSTMAPFDANIAANAQALIVTTFVKGVSGFKGSEAVDELNDGWGLYDLGLQNAILLLKATDLGLDTIVLGLRDAVAIQQLLNISEQESVVSVIAVGYRAKESSRPKRKDIEEIVSYY